MGNIRSNQPPTGYELVVNVPDYGPETFDITGGSVDVYESAPQTRDGVTTVRGSWSATDGVSIMVEQGDNEVWLSRWAAEQLVELLTTAVAEAQS